VDPGGTITTIAGSRYGDDGFAGDGGPATEALLNRPTGFRLPVRGLVPSAGAGFVVALCGDMQRMPGLGKTPNYMGVDIDGDGRTVGLF